MDILVKVYGGQVGSLGPANMSSLDEYTVYFGDECDSVSFYKIEEFHIGGTWYTR